MSTESQNPLAAYFRRPAIYVKLPSQGRWWAESSLDLPAIGEIGIYPMTAKDEITLRTPDALLNGQGVVDVIHSCCPNIKDAWEMPSIDVDTVLIAIRIASYGNTLSFDSKCPHCNEENVHEIDLGNLVGSVGVPDYNTPVTYKGLKIKLNPQKYYTINRVNQLSFEQEKLSNMLANTADAEPAIKAANLKQIMERIMDIGITAVTESTEYIEIDGGDRISDKKHINEFYQMAEVSVTKDIQERLLEISRQAKMPELNLVCNECTKAYELDLQFDYANFFGKGF